MIAKIFIKKLKKWIMIKINLESFKPFLIKLNTFLKSKIF